jgi:hypothetical protein
MYDAVDFAGPHREVGKVGHMVRWGGTFSSSGVLFIKQS